MTKINYYMAQIIGIDAVCVIMAGLNIWINAHGIVNKKYAKESTRKVSAIYFKVRIIFCHLIKDQSQ